MEPVMRESMEVKQLGVHSVGSKDAEREAAVADTAAPGSAVESILQVMQVEEEFVSLTRIDPDPTYVEDKVVVGIVVAAAGDVAAAAVPEPTLGPIHHGLHRHRGEHLNTSGGRCYSIVAIVE